VLGIFGREGLDLATRWTVPVNPSPTYLAMEIYRNYDGKLSTFGDTSVSAAVANPDHLSSFAGVRSSDGALTVMAINKQQGSTPVTISLANFGTTGTAQAYQIASASQASITQLGSIQIANNAIAATLPSQSITLFVVPAGSITSAPTAPAGLAATVGSGTVTLTWTAGGGATS
jgi:O-glycosyl hydrolase